MRECGGEAAVTSSACVHDWERKRRHRGREEFTNLDAILAI